MRNARGNQAAIAPSEREREMCAPRFVQRDNCDGEASKVPELLPDLRLRRNARGLCDGDAAVLQQLS